MRWKNVQYTYMDKLNNCKIDGEMLKGKIVVECSFAKGFSVPKLLVVANKTTSQKYCCSLYGYTYIIYICMYNTYIFIRINAEKCRVMHFLFFSLWKYKPEYSSFIYVIVLSSLILEIRWLYNFIC